MSAAAALQLVATPPAGKWQDVHPRSWVCSAPDSNLCTDYAEAIATQTDMYARPQMSDTKNKTGQVAKVAMRFAHRKHKALQAFSSLQPEQAKDPLEAGSGAIAADPGKENRKLPKGAELADENSRMMRSTSGSAARGPGGKANK